MHAAHRRHARREPIVGLPPGFERALADGWSGKSCSITAGPTESRSSAEVGTELVEPPGRRASRRRHATWRRRQGGDGDHPDCRSSSPIRSERPRRSWPAPAEISPVFTHPSLSWRQMARAAQGGRPRLAGSLSLNPDKAPNVAYCESFEAAPALGVKPSHAEVRSINDIDSAFDCNDARTRRAFMIGCRPASHSSTQADCRRLRQRLPSIFRFGTMGVDGGLMSYGVEPPNVSGRAAPTLTASSRAPSQPICRSSSRPSSSWSSTSRPPRRSASTVPPTLLARADEVIE